MCNVELSLSSIKKKKKKKKKKIEKNRKKKKTYFGGKKRTAVFSFKKRTKYGKNVLVGISASTTFSRIDFSAYIVPKFPIHI